MRTFKLLLAVTSLLPMGAASGQHKPQTDAQSDGFSGSIKSVVSTTFLQAVPWRQPDGLALVWPVSCLECEYDPGGARVRFGQGTEAGFEGDNIQVSRDADGHIYDRRTLDSSTGVLKVHEVLGPFGLTEQTVYERGKVSSSRTIRYDSFGYISETASFDGSGLPVEHTHGASTPEGVRTEDSTWGKNGQLEWQQLFDPAKHEESFTSFDDAGVVKLAWTRKDGKMTAFVKRSDEDNQFGDCLTDDETKGTSETHCFANGNRERAVIREQYMEPKSLGLKSAEWRDGAGTLLYGAYYEYQVDSRSNWTQRSIWVISPEVPERTLYEEDTRALVYW